VTVLLRRRWGWKVAIPVGLIVFLPAIVYLCLTLWTVCCAPPMPCTPTGRDAAGTPNPGSASGNFNDDFHRC